MFAMGRLALPLIGLLFACTAAADDLAAPQQADDAAAEDSPTLKQLLDESAYGARWRIPSQPDATRSAPQLVQPLNDFAFQDNSGLGRVRQMRNFSLLTLAQSGQARLFFGVNEDGLVGLHFRAISREDEGRYLEFARMPHLEEDESDTEKGTEIPPQ